MITAGNAAKAPLVKRQLAELSEVLFGLPAPGAAGQPAVTGGAR
jgi:hypothetical protein